jgi:hypothetical protein
VSGARSLSCCARRIRRPPADRRHRAGHRDRASEAPRGKTAHRHRAAGGRRRADLPRSESRPRPRAPTSAARRAGKSAPRVPAFPLTDPPRRFDIGMGRPAPVSARRFHAGRWRRGGRRGGALPPPAIAERGARQSRPPRQTPRPPARARKRLQGPCRAGSRQQAKRSLRARTTERPCASAIRPAIAGDWPTRSPTCCASVTGWPCRCRASGRTRREETAAAHVPLPGFGKEAPERCHALPRPRFRGRGVERSETERGTGSMANNPLSVPSGHFSPTPWGRGSGPLPHAPSVSHVGEKEERSGARQRGRSPKLKGGTEDSPELTAKPFGPINPAW